jgi:AbrB family looped-hinge helix DNA binding protein
MQTKVSSRGQVVLPGPIRRRLGLQTGDTLEVSIDSERILLSPKRKRSPRARIVRDPLTGLPVLRSGPKAPKITSKMVKEILADFP